MFQKNSIMSLKKKSKSLGHLTALGSPNFGSPKMKKHISVKNFNVSDRLKFLNHSYTTSPSGGSTAMNPGPSASNGIVTSPSEHHVYRQHHNHHQHQPHHHHPPPTRSTTALNLGTPMAEQKAEQARSKSTTPKVRHAKKNIFLI